MPLHPAGGLGGCGSWAFARARRHGASLQQGLGSVPPLRPVTGWQLDATPGKEHSWAQLFGDGTETLTLCCPGQSGSGAGGEVGTGPGCSPLVWEEGDGGGKGGEHPHVPPPGPPLSWVMTHRVLWPGAAMGSSPGSALTSTPCSFIAAFQLELSRASAPSHLLQQRLNAARLPRRGMESPNSTTPVTPWEETRTSGPPATPQKRAPTHTGSP